jgi:hypothetical protein
MLETVLTVLMAAIMLIGAVVTTAMVNGERRYYRARQRRLN